MAHRTPRRRSEADIYHVYLRGSGRQLIFEDDLDRQAFLRILADAAKEADAMLYAYVLMGNHYHLVVKCDYDKLPTFAHKLNCTYATYFNDRHDRKGHLFETRYKSQPIDDDSYFLEAIRYVHRNPVAAHMCPDCNYPWSSYTDYLATTDLVGCCSSGSCRLVTDTLRVLGMLGGREAFMKFHSYDCKRRFADDRPYGSTLTEPDMIAIAREALNGFEPSNLKSLPKQDRDRGLRLLKLSILSQAQIALVTGLSTSTVSRA